MKCQLLKPRVDDLPSKVGTIGLVPDRGWRKKKPIEHNFQAHFATLLIVSSIVDGSYVKHFQHS